MSPRFYDSPAWRKLRARHRRAFPRCAVFGCTALVEHVDHIVSITTDPRRALDPSNLQSLCHKHHNILTASYDRNSLRGACGIDGMPTDPSHPWFATTGQAAIDAANAKPRSDPLLAAGLKRRAVKGRTR